LLSEFFVVFVLAKNNPSLSAGQIWYIFVVHIDQDHRANKRADSMDDDSVGIVIGW